MAKWSDLMVEPVGRYRRVTEDPPRPGEYRLKRFDVKCDRAATMARLRGLDAPRGGAPCPPSTGS
jgi:hypothetical protein